MSEVRDRLRRVPALALAVHTWRQWCRERYPEPRPTSFGFKLAGNRAMEAGTFEEAELSLLRELLRSDDVFLDIGANIGLYTCLARSLGCTAIAIEPLRANLRWLYANLSANSWHDTEVLPVGLGPCTGLATIYGSDTGASLLPGWAGAVDHPFLQHIIPVNTLDNVLGERFPGRRLVIKADIEGAELGLLRGAVRTLARVPKPVWLVEIVLSEHRAGALNPDFADTFDRFFDAGYRASTATHPPRTVGRDDVARWVAQGRSEHTAYNYLFTVDH